ncbi:hypothetical protein OAU65_00980 [Gammaproteobacteria bacterium]|nr:hypothetical protein [Gammaproteobacteria bacterium]
MKILCVLDSHLGELHNIVPMFFHWGSNGELKSCHIDFVYIGHNLNSSIIQEELNILRPFVTFSLTVLPIVSPKITSKRKLFNFLLLSIRYVLLRNYDLTFIPYDQRDVFNIVFKIGSRKLVAVPHTTGDEVYSKDVFKNRNLRNKKKFPVLTKSTASSEYFLALGFHDCIVTGKYFECQEYLDLIHSNNEVKDETKKLCIFTLTRTSKLFSEKNWLQVHYDILISAAEAGFSNVFIKTHPSQPKEDLDDLFIFADKLSIKILLVSGNPIIAASRFDIFITVLTSAGQHAKSVGKPVCCFASFSMREEVKDFGNDPYPFKDLGVIELVSQKELVQWLDSSNELIVSSDPIKKPELLSLDQLYQLC